MIKKFEQLLRRILMFFLLSLSRRKKLSEQLPVIKEETKILFIRLNRIGDALVSTPLIELTKKKTGCIVYVLADKKNYFVFKNNPNIDDVIIFEKGIKNFFKLKKFIKQKEIDILVDLHDDVSTTVSFLIAVVECEYKLGLKKSNSEIYTHTVDRINSDRNHVIVRTSEISKLLGLNYSKEELRIGYYPKEENIHFAKEFVKTTFPERKYLLGINISAGSDARFWGVENFRSLLNELSRYDLNILIFTDTKDYDKAQLIFEKKFIYPAFKDFDKFAAGILELDMLFSPDTSAIHIASIKRIPVFGLYVKYKTNDMIWSPYNTDFECVITEEPNLNNVTFKEVKKKFIPFLEKYLNGERNSKL